MSAPVDTSRQPLTIDELRVDIGSQTLVRDVSLTLQAGSVHCLVGESGSGKTLTSLAAVGLLPPGAVPSGSIRLAGLDDDLLGLDQPHWSSIRGRQIGYVGQNALGCLHPAFRIEAQLIEAVRRHRSMSKAAARAIAIEELAAVDLPDPERIARSRPAELSGGMCQRVALAIALCNRPAILIADEPTTALDDDTQGHVLDLIRARVDSDGLSVLLITHDRRVVERMADQVTSIAEGATSPTESREPTPSIPVTSPAPASVAGDERANEPTGYGDRPDVDPTLEIIGVGKTYGRGGWRRQRGAPVLSDVTITATPGTTLGLVGRSGAGKTTLAQIVAGVLAPSEGSVRIGGRPITGDDRVGRVEKAGLVQYVFQNPFGSLNPRRSALAQVAEPLVANGRSADEARDQARSLLADVGLTSTQAERLPTALSGGQCQRVGIARALIRRPLVVVLDEPVSALDWSIRDEILSILNELQASTGALYLLISHERPLIDRECDRVFEVADGKVLAR
ncbi:MAG: ATP-binding cassette domain-containing protein [Actinomycetota bacterium]